MSGAVLNTINTSAASTPRNVYAAIRDHGVTHLCGAPVVLSLNMLANAPEGVRNPLHRKVRVMTAGAPPPAAVLHRAEALSFDVSHWYGLTETAGTWCRVRGRGSGSGTSCPRRSARGSRQGRACARPALPRWTSSTQRAPGRRHHGRDRAPRRVHNACLLGYLNDGEPTRAAIRDDGWFYTGGMGVMHPDGYLEIRDRSKDEIISGGENISSVEVESMLYSHPEVSKASVVARPDEF
uniref:4-coumarate--CoA ligase-like protein 6 n=1 Tax=Aegilops tauschii TaxID=37682 RepID=R7WE32_AEGTA